MPVIEPSYSSITSIMLQLANKAPASTTGNTNFARLIGGALGAPGDINQQALSEAFLKFDLYSDFLTDDALPFIGLERALPRYSGESTASHRARLKLVWDTWILAGPEQSILGQLAIMGYTADIHFDMPGGGETVAPTQPGRNAQQHIRAYPASHDWWAQYILRVYKTEIIAGDAVPWTDSVQVYSGAPSQLLYQYELDTIRAINDLFHPTGWLCREIIITPGTSVSTFGWDQSIGWDNATSGWDDSSSGAFVERYPRMNVTDAKWQSFA